MPILRFLGSLNLALFLIGAMGVLLTISTFMESVYGTPFAQNLFYKSLWFDLFLSLLGVNIFCSTLRRIPFRKKHTGFVITHIGILILLTGSLLSRLLGVEGQMSLFEGQAKNRIQQEGLELRIYEPNGASEGHALSRRSVPFEITPADENGRIDVLEIVEHASDSKLFSEGPAGAPPNRALQATLESKTVGFHQTFWLVEKDPANPHASFMNIGPARVELETAAASAESAEASLLLFAGENPHPFVLKLREGENPDRAVEGTDLKITNLRYYPAAKVLDNRIVNAPEDVRFNPAVEFEIHDSEGRREHHTRFQLFPAFGSLRGGEAGNVFGLNVQLEAPLPDGLRRNDSPSLLFFVTPEGRWKYRVSSSKGGSSEGDVEVGKATPTGWMDFQFRVNRLLERAELSRLIKKAEEETGQSAALLRITAKDGAQSQKWVLSGQPVQYETPLGPVTLSLEPKSREVPFSLLLHDFRKIDYPGTQNPSSYESDVTLEDAKEPLKITKTIRMNKPLDHRGYRIFQSSYIQDPELGEASVFTVARNPGIALIYSGSVVILIGVILLFYLHPFFTGKNENGS